MYGVSVLYALGQAYLSHPNVWGRTASGKPFIRPGSKGLAALYYTSRAIPVPEVCIVHSQTKRMRDINKRPKNV